MSGEALTAERIARNDAAFRRANEQIRQAAEEYEISASVPFICECANPVCREIVTLSLAEYEHVRSGPTRFFKATGHEKTGAQATRVVERRDGYVIVVKTGEAARVAVELDPRNG